MSKGVFDEFAPNEEELKIMRDGPAADQPAELPEEDEFEDKNGDDADRPRDEKGRFAQKQPEQAQPEPAPEAEEEEEGADEFKSFLAKQ